MSSSLDLSARARIALAASLVITAWGLPRLPLVQRLAGGTAAPLAAGACALVALLAARLPLGFRWGPPRSARLVPDVARGFAVGAVCAAGLLFDDNAARLAAVWHDDRAASVALLAGAAAWGAADRKSTRLNSSHSQISYAVFCLKKKNTTYIHPANGDDVVVFDVS